MTRLLILIALCSAPACLAQFIDIYFIDTEGGQSTLIVNERKQSMLIDAGWVTAEAREAGRIVATAKRAGLSRIDSFVLTHYHEDHVGGVEALAERFPIGAFYDHGPNNESSELAKRLSASYDRVKKPRHVVVKPGEKLPLLAGVDVTVVASNREMIQSALPGAGQPNPLCASSERSRDDRSENARSVATLIQFGRFRFADLADLTWNTLHNLSCPANLLGKADVYLVGHHGLTISNPGFLVHALQPRVAIMNNGARKGGEAVAWQVVKKSPGLEDLWQLHYSEAGGQENNVDEALIANPELDCKGVGLHLRASLDGSFTIVNERNGHRKSYPVKAQPR